MCHLYIHDVFSLGYCFIMVPVAVVTLSEHIGHQLVLSKVVDRNYIKKPGLHRSILGDGQQQYCGINWRTTKNNIW